MIKLPKTDKEKTILTAALFVLMLILIVIFKREGMNTIIIILTVIGTFGGIVLAFKNVRDNCQVRNTKIESIYKAQLNNTLIDSGSDDMLFMH